MFNKEEANKDLNEAIKDDFNNFFDKTIYKMRKSINRCNEAFALGGMTALSLSSVLLNEKTGLAPELLSNFDSTMVLGMAGIALSASAVSLTGFLRGKMLETNLSNIESNPDIIKDDFMEDVKKMTISEKCNLTLIKRNEKMQKAMGHNVLAQKLKEMEISHFEAINENVKIDMDQRGLGYEFDNFVASKKHDLSKTLSKSQGVFFGTGMTACALASMALQSTNETTLNFMSPEYTTMALAGAAALGLGSVLSGIKMRRDGLKVKDANNLENHIDEFNQTVESTDSKLSRKLSQAEQRRMHIKGEIAERGLEDRIKSYGISDQKADELRAIQKEVLKSESNKLDEEGYKPLPNFNKNKLR